MESFETEQMIQYAFYINIVITTGLAWFCLRSGLHYNFFRKAESARTKGLSSTSTEHGPAIVRLKKLQALVDFISNCAFLILSIGTAYILYVWNLFSLITSHGLVRRSYDFKPYVIDL